MLELLKNLRDKEAKEKGASLARYRSLIELDDAATSKQVDELAELARKLGRDADQVEKDIRAIGNRRHFAKIAAELPARKSKHEASRKATADFTAEMQKTMRELEQRHDELLRVSQSDERIFHEARRAEEKLVALNKQHFELYGLPEPEPDLPPHLSAPINLAKAAGAMTETERTTE